MKKRNYFVSKTVAVALAAVLSVGVITGCGGKENAEDSKRLLLLMFHTILPESFMKHIMNCLQNIIRKKQEKILR